MWCFVSLFSLVVSTITIDCLERLVSEMTYYVSSGMLNVTHSFTYSETFEPISCTSTVDLTYNILEKNHKLVGSWENKHPMDCDAELVATCLFTPTSRRAMK